MHFRMEPAFCSSRTKSLSIFSLSCSLSCIAPLYCIGGIIELAFGALKSLSFRPVIG